MARFQFRLRTLLKLREATRDERRRKLAEAQLASSRLTEQRDELQAQIADLGESQLDASRPGSVKVNQLLAHGRYKGLLSANIQTMQEQLKTLANETERRRQALLEADRDVRVLERLQEIQQQRHHEGLLHKEQKELDEIASRTRMEGV